MEQAGDHDDVAPSVHVSSKPVSGAAPSAGVSISGVEPGVEEKETEAGEGGAGAAAVAVATGGVAVGEAGSGSGTGVNLIIDLVQKKESTNEQSLKTLFDHYSSDRDGNWNKRDLTRFLLDLQSALGSPSVIPEESVRAALTDLQLNEVAENIVTWVEFKSFCMYLHDTPFQDLLNTANKSIDVDELKTRGVLITKLSAGVTAKDILEVLSKSGVTVSKIYVNESDLTSALVVVKTVSDVGKVLEFSGHATLGKGILTASAYRADVPFPASLSTEAAQKKSKVVATVAPVLAEGVVLAHQAGKKLSEIDDDLKISATVKAGAAAAKEKANEVDEKYQITQTVKAGAAAVDEKLKVSQAVESVKQTTAKVTTAMMQNDTVKKGMGLFSSFASSVSSSWSELTTETMKIANEKEGKPAEVKNPQELDTFKKQGDSEK